MRKCLKRGNLVGAVILMVLSVISIILFALNGFVNTGFKSTEVVPQQIENIGIPIAMAMDDNYVYPTMVSITSAMENIDSGTEYSFYIMHDPNFKEENKEKIKSLESKYPDCHIHLINMGNQFKGANDKGHITTPTYYRLSLSGLLKDIDKIIWLDGDTLIFKDLTQMYNIDMDGLCYRGFLDETVDGAKAFGVENDHYICAGVMLINLEELRKDGALEKFDNFIDKNNNSLIQHDQTVINVVYADKIGILPPEYGFFNSYATEELAEKYCAKLKCTDKYKKEDMNYALNNLSILHCIVKPWKFFDVYFADLWWEYAQKTDYYDEIKLVYSYDK